MKVSIEINLYNFLLKENEMRLRNKVVIAGIIYIVFMVCFTGFYLPSFYNATDDNEMVDLYLSDYSKNIEDIEQLIMDYGEDGRAFMQSFFIVDSLYIIISVILFMLLLKGLTSVKLLQYVPILTGIFDTLENIIVLYSTNSLNMDYLIYARIFSSAKGVTLLLSIIIIVFGAIRLTIGWIKNKGQDK